MSPALHSPSPQRPAICARAPASQVDAPATAGRFGLGFNAVYHFTDVPSFVSGDTLVYFDPHAANLPGTTLGQPGLKISLASGRLLAQFPDQFAPFLQFGCAMGAGSSPSFPGARALRFASPPNIASATVAPQPKMRKPAHEGASFR